MSDKRKKKVKEILVVVPKKDQKVEPINKQKGEAVKASHSLFSGKPTKASDVLKKGLKFLKEKLTPKTLDEQIEEKKKQFDEIRKKDKKKK